MREIWSKQAQVLHIRTYSYELELNWNFRDLTSFSMMWKTRELAMMVPKWTTHSHYIGQQMNLHKAQKPIKPKRVAMVVPYERKMK